MLFPDVRPLLFLQPLRRLASGEAAPHTLAPLAHRAADGELSLNGKWIDQARWLKKLIPPAACPSQALMPIVWAPVPVYLNANELRG